MLAGSCTPIDKIPCASVIAVTSNIAVSDPDNIAAVVS